jgi:hypothetical protein
MDRGTLLFLLKGGHIDMSTRVARKLWPHSPLLLGECIDAILDFLRSNKFFPVPWVEKKNGELIGDLMVIEKIDENNFLCKYRYSNPLNLLKISDVGEKTFKSGYEAVKYYLQHELYLPGDLDGWKVIDD